MSPHEGWLIGLRDRYVSRGLALMYGRPGDHWTVESLARTVGVSRTALADHFVQCTGMAPMRYLSQWRLRVAADGLRHTDSAIKLIAEAAGFGSTAAFAPRLQTRVRRVARPVEAKSAYRQASRSRTSPSRSASDRGVTPKQEWA